MPDLAEPLLKLEWAGAHLQCFDRMRRAFLDRNPYVAVREFDLETRTYTCRAKIIERAPAEFGLKIGDVLTNLRASLDFLLWQLLLIGNPNPAAFFTYFPILDYCFEVDANRFHGLTINVRSDARREIEALQPYYRGKRFRDDPLSMLNALCNIDKHQALTVVGAHTPVIVNTGRMDGGIRMDSFGGVFNDGDVLARYTPISKSETNFEPELAFDVAFPKEGPASGRPVMDGLTLMHDYIRDDVLPRFTHFF